jgi:GAF domain-containing protein
MFEKVRSLFAAPSFEIQERSRVARLLNTTLLVTLGLMLLAAPTFIFFNETSQDMWRSLSIVGGFILVCVFLTGLLHLRYVYIAGSLFVLLLWTSVTLGMLMFGGVRSSITPAYLLTIALATILLGRRGAITFGSLSLVALIAVFFAELRGADIVSPPREVVALDNVFMISIVLALMTLVMVLFQDSMRDRVTEEQQDKAALQERVQELEGSQEALETRTAQLQRRSVQLRTAAEVAREMTALRSLDELLSRTVNLIAERFNLYHVGLFLIDDVGEYAILRMAAGHAAEQLITHAPRIPVGGEGTVGYVTGTGRPYLVNDVTQDERFLDNEFLQETCAELMLPMRAGGEIIGAMGVQSDRYQAFDEDDMAVLQAVADQLAVAVENARILDEMQQKVLQLESTVGQVTQETWEAVVARQQAAGYRYRRMGVEPARGRTPEMEQALTEGKIVLQSGGNGDEMSVLAVPLRLRNQVIGVLNLRFEGAKPSRNVLELMENLAERLALALENARLYEETQRRVAREQKAVQITSEVRSVLNVEDILERAIQELGRSMGAVDGWIQLEQDAFEPTSGEDSAPEAASQAD